MTDARVVAESLFDRNRRREAEINEALQQESARMKLPSRICNA